MSNEANEELEERREFINTFVKDHPTCESSELYSELYRRWPDVPKGTLRSLVYRELPEGERPWDQTTTCPKDDCDSEATGLEDIQEVFGFRNMADGRRRVQSWCRKCRIEDAKQRRKARQDAAKKAKAKKEAKKAEKVADTVSEDTAEKVVEKGIHEMDKAELVELTNKTLKGYLRDFGLKVGGTKSELVNRLHGFLKTEAGQGAILDAAFKGKKPDEAKAEFTVKDLRAICAFREAPVSGTKDELIERLTG